MLNFYYPRHCYSSLLLLLSDNGFYSAGSHHGCYCHFCRRSAHGGHNAARSLSIITENSNPALIFWTYNPTGWFQLAEAELWATHYNLEDSTCYIVILWALSQEVLSPTDVPDAYLQLHQALISPYSLNYNTVFQSWAHRSLKSLFRSSLLSEPSF